MTAPISLNTGSMSSWVRFNGSPGGPNIFSIGNTSFVQVVRFAYISGFLTAIASDGVDSFNFNSFFAGDSNFHHYVLTWDTDIAIMYMDGIQLANSTGFGTINLDDLNWHSIGSNLNGNQPVNGWIDDYAIYDDVLSPVEVLSTYDRGILGLANNIAGNRIYYEPLDYTVNDGGLIGDSFFTSSDELVIAADLTFVGVASCQLVVTDGFFNVFDTTLITVISPNFQFNVSDVGMEFICIQW